MRVLRDRLLVAYVGSVLVAMTVLIASPLEWAVAAMFVGWIGGVLAEKLMERQRR